MKSSLIRSVAKELAKKHPFSLDLSLQRMRFCRRWCLNIQKELASGKPIKPAGRTAAPAISAFSLEKICSACKDKFCVRLDTHYSNYEPFLGLLLLKEAPNPNPGG
jgi:hypothetical protein